MLTVPRIASAARIGSSLRRQNSYAKPNQSARFTEVVTKVINSAVCRSWSVIVAPLLPHPNTPEHGDSGDRAQWTAARSPSLCDQLDAYSDRRIGEECNVPAACVVRLRETAYGPIRVDPELAALKADAAELAAKVAALADRIKAAEARAMGKVARHRGLVSHSPTRVGGNQGVKVPS